MSCKLQCGCFSGVLMALPFICHKCRIDEISLFLCQGQLLLWQLYKITLDVAQQSPVVLIVLEGNLEMVLSGRFAVQCVLNPVQLLSLTTAYLLVYCLLSQFLFHA